MSKAAAPLVLSHRLACQIHPVKLEGTTIKGAELLGSQLERAQLLGELCTELLDYSVLSRAILLL